MASCLHCFFLSGTGIGCQRSLQRLLFSGESAVIDMHGHGVGGPEGYIKLLTDRRALHNGALESLELDLCGSKGIKSVAFNW